MADDATLARLRRCAPSWRLRFFLVLVSPGPPELTVGDFASRSVDICAKEKPLSPLQNRLLWMNKGGILCGGSLRGSHEETVEEGEHTTQVSRACTFTEKGAYLRGEQRYAALCRRRLFHV